MRTKASSPWRWSSITSSRSSTAPLAPQGDRDPVGDAEHDRVDPLVGGDALVGADDRLERLASLTGPRPRAHRVVAIERGGHRAAVEDVVDDRDAARAQELDHRLPVLRVRRLVGVDEGEVEGRGTAKVGERLERRRVAQVDPPGHARLLPVAAGERRLLLAHVAGDERAAGAESVRDADRGVAGERAELERAPGADRAA